MAAELKPTRPVLRYHGGKWLLAEWIISHFPPHDVYTEVFAGAGSVLMQKPRSAAEILNDLNDDLVNLFRVLRCRAQSAELMRLLELTPYAYAEFIAALEPAEDAVERARRLVVSSFMSVGTDGTTRGSNAGFRNYSRTDKIGTIPVRQWPSYVANLRAVTERLQGVIIERREAHHVLRQHDSPRSLHYVDPPYVHSSRAQGRGKYKYEMGDDAHRALAATLHELEGMVILSGYSSDLYDLELYSDWHRVEREALADGARPRTEVLWINEAAWKAKHDSHPLFNTQEAAASAPLN